MLSSTSGCAHAVQLVAETQDVQLVLHTLQTPLLSKLPSGQVETASTVSGIQNLVGLSVCCVAAIRQHSLDVT